MPTIMPHSDLVRQAVEYIALEIRNIREKEGDEPTPARIYEMVEKACLRFDLTPRESGMLHDLLERDKIES